MGASNKLAIGEAIILRLQGADWNEIAILLTGDYRNATALRKQVMEYTYVRK